MVFDCDSTLTKVEGIDELAQRTGRAEEVRRLTDAAMSGYAELEDVFGLRVEAADPTRGAVHELDLMASPSVDLVAGFGGVVERPAVAQRAAVYIRSESLAPMLPLAAGRAGDQLGDPRLRSVFDSGVRLAREGSVEFRDPELAHRFAAAFDVVD